jgi:hypothetical protein
MDKFEIPDDLPHIPPGRTEPLSKNTTKVYRHLLKDFAKRGYYNRQLLIDNSNKVLDIMVSLTTSTDVKQTRQKQRQYLSAIMYVMTEEYKKTPNAYYAFFQKAKDPESEWPQEYKDRKATFTIDFL